MGRLILKALFWALLAAVCGSLLFGIYLRSKQTRTLIVLAPSDDKPTPEQLKEMCRVLQQRLKEFGGEFGVVRSRVVAGDGGKIFVALRSKGDCEGIVKHLTRKGAVEFRLVAPGHKRGKEYDKPPEGYELLPMRKRVYSLSDIGSSELVVEYLPVEKEPEMVVRRFEDVSTHTVGFWARPIVTIKFREEDKTKFAEITRKNIGRQLAVVIDSEVLAAPVVTSPVKDGVVRIERLDAISPARRLARILKIGAAPFTVKVLDIQTERPRGSSVKDAPNAQGEGHEE